MQLAHACYASLLLHSAMLAIPTGSLTPNALAEGAAPARARLAVVLREPAGGAVGERGLLREPSDTAGEPPQPLGVPGPRYYEPKELTRRAKAIGDISPLPPALERGDDSGRVVFVLRIASTGRVDGVEIDQATVGDALVTALADRFRALRFHPAERDGVAVASRMKIEVLLRPPGA